MRSASERKLVFFIHSMGGGGAERVTANMANHWAGKGWDITVVTLAALSLDFYDLHPAVRRIALNLAGDSGNVLVGLGQNLRRVVAMRQVLKQLEPDIALGMMTSSSVLLSFAAWGRRGAAVGSEHVHPPQYPLSTMWESVRRRSYGLLHAVTALTGQTAAWLAAQTNARHITVIPNAVPWPLPAQEPRLSVDSVCRAGRPILLAVGRLEAQKGFDSLVGVFADLAQKHPGWDLVVLGEGAQRPQLESIVQAAGMVLRIFLPGRVGNLHEWYERADLFVMSSRFEGFGNTLAEALAHGLPAVSFDCDTGPRDIVRHELDGLLVPPGDMAGLTDALDRLMGRADLRLDFGQRAVEARQRFSLERIAGLWETLFADIGQDKFPPHQGKK